MQEFEYKFNEDNLITELKKYVDATYTEHYSGKYQATDMIIDAGHGMGFCIGSIMKYAKRYGKKDGTNRKDIMKILHYALISLYIHDEGNRKQPFTKFKEELEDVISEQHSTKPYFDYSYVNNYSNEFPDYLRGFLKDTKIEFITATGFKGINLLKDIYWSNHIVKYRIIND
jgi:hypothetical protein